MVDNFVQRVMWRIPWQKLNKLNLLNEKANNNKKQDTFKGGAGGKDSCQGDSGGPLAVRVRLKLVKPFFHKKMYKSTQSTQRASCCATLHCIGCVSCIGDDCEQLLWKCGINEISAGSCIIAHNSP